MKDLFYGLFSFILSFLIITGVVFLFNADKKIYKYPKETTGIVIHKTDDFLVGQRVYILNGDSIYNFNCFDIVFTNSEIGDSIKNGQIYKMKKEMDGL
jgi:hypothetical protein